MNPVVKYTLGRVGLFVGALLILWPVRAIGPWATLLIALMVSIVLSWFVLRGWRDELTGYLEVRARRREAERRQLRATLDGEVPDETDGRANDTGEAGAGEAAGDTRAGNAAGDTRAGEAGVGKDDPGEDGSGRAG